MSVALPRLAACAGMALLLAACGGPRGDWRAEFGRTQPNRATVTPGPPLVIPAVLDLPPPRRADPRG